MGSQDQALAKAGDAVEAVGDAGEGDPARDPVEAEKREAQDDWPEGVRGVREVLKPEEPRGRSRRKLEREV
jgi:hypothetical protein